MNVSALPISIHLKWPSIRHISADVACCEAVTTYVKVKSKLNIQYIGTPCHFGRLGVIVCHAMAIIYQGMSS